MKPTKGPSNLFVKKTTPKLIPFVDGHAKNANQRILGIWVPSSSLSNAFGFPNKLPCLIWFTTPFPPPFKFHNQREKDEKLQHASFIHVSHYSSLTCGCYLRWMINYTLRREHKISINQLYDRSRNGTCRGKTCRFDSSEQDRFSGVFFFSRGVGSNITEVITLVGGLTFFTLSNFPVGEKSKLTALPRQCAGRAMMKNEDS